MTQEITFIAKSVDLNLNALYCTLVAPYAVGSRMAITLNLPGGDTHLEGTIVLCEPSSVKENAWDAALTYDEPDKPAQGRLLAYLMAQASVTPGKVH